MYKASSLQQVLDAFSHQWEWGVSQLADHLGKHRNLIHRYLNVLVEQKKVEKIWSSPRTVYRTLGETTPQTKDQIDFSINYQDAQILENEFFKLSSVGEKLIGKDWFAVRCHTRELDPQQKFANFIDIAQHVNSSKNECGLLDATPWFKTKMQEWVLHKLYYADQYKWMEFGRWKLAEITYHGKDSQNIVLIKQGIGLIKHQLECLISSEDIDAIAFTPHSRRREIQLLKELKKSIDTQGLPEIKLLKYAPNGIIIAQKSLKTRKERIENARRTIILQDHDLSAFKKVLLIDDFVGSGATLNETAKKIIAAWAKKVIGFAFVGNLNLSYEVIREM